MSEDREALVQKYDWGFPAGWCGRPLAIQVDALLRWHHASEEEVAILLGVDIAEVKELAEERWVYCNCSGCWLAFIGDAPLSEKESDVVRHHMRQAERVARSAYPPSQTEVTPVLTARDRFALKYGWHYAADSRAVPRPQQVASLALRGASVNETAVLLGIQEATVKTYLYATVAKPRGLKPTGKVAHRIFLKYLAILPAEIAKEQAAFELDTMIARAVEQGAKLKECAQVLGVSALRVSQRRDKGNRRRKGPSTPIGRYFAEVSELVCMRPESQSPVPSWQNAMFGAWAGMGL